MAEVRTVHHATLLRFLGCTADASETAWLTGGDERAFLAAMAPAVMGSPSEVLSKLLTTIGADQPWRRRVALLARALADPRGGARSMSTHCEVAAMLAERAGLDSALIEALAHAYERWDGRGFPAGLSGHAIPLSVRVFVVARDADLATLLREDPLHWMQRRKGNAYDPTVVEAFEAVGPRVLAQLDQADEWDAALSAEPEPVSIIRPESLDRVLLAFADFADLKSPWMRGHSRRVADLAEAAALHAGLRESERITLRRAALLHDLGCVGIENRIWDKPGELTRAERERVRLHTYYTHRILERCSALADLAELACSHHERIDGSGYHRGLEQHALSQSARILAVADAFAALTAERPYRAPFAAADAARALATEAPEGLDNAAVAWVLAAAEGKRPPRSRRWPAGLTDREVDVLRLIARGHSNKVVAKRLHISVKTVGRHIENLYRKLDVSSRAAAAVFAMQHDLLD